MLDGESTADDLFTSEDLRRMLESFNERLDDLNHNISLRASESRRSRSIMRLLTTITVFVLMLTVVIGIGLIVMINTSSNQSDQASVIGSITKDNQDRINCISDWANATNARTQALSKLASTRTDAIDALVLRIALPDPKVSPKVSVQNAFKEYLKAEGEYKQGLKDNPIPATPAFNCK